jgi:cytoplasmic iron level regulating protein YaaA (DUF328/UPF0246 family)
VDSLHAFLLTSTLKQRSTVFSAQGSLLERATSSILDLERGKVPLLPAWRRYEGVVWTHLDPGSLVAAQRRDILVPSGLYGLVTSEDPIADYRLKMNASFAPIGTLARFWRSTLTSLLEQRFKNKTIVNLLPHEHAASIDFAALSKCRRVINVHFVAADEKRAVGHDAKAVKGVVARRLLVEGTGVLDDMEWQGWRVRREGDDVFVTAST